MRKILKAATKTELTKHLENHVKRGWQAISDVKVAHGGNSVYQVLVEREDYKRYE